MTPSNFFRFFFALSLVLVSTFVTAQSCKCRVEQVKNEAVFSVGCAIPEEICSLEVGTGVKQVDLRRFADLRGIHIKLGKNVEATFLGSAQSDSKTMFIGNADVTVTLFDDVNGDHRSLRSSTGNKPGSLKAYNKELKDCFGDCTLITPAASLANLREIDARFVLPVTLLSWEAVTIRQGVELSWSTEEESDNDYFTLLRSSDGITFEEVAKVTGNGSTDRVSSYRFVDPTARAGTYYYQLEQVDFDGTRTALGLRQVSVTNAPAAEVMGMSPNPAGAGHEVTVHLTDAANTPVRIVDLTGRAVAETTLDAGGRFWVPAELHPGLYVVIVRDQATRLVVRP